MKTVLKTAQAGTLESNDAIVTIVPGASGSGLNIEIESGVLIQYGDAIRKVIEETLTGQSVSDVYVKVMDRGALDCTIRARVLAALVRADVELGEAFR
jgi:citrate lyase subunit gamma (acyl carrier protein)